MDLSDELLGCISRRLLVHDAAAPAKVFRRMRHKELETRQRCAVALVAAITEGKEYEKAFKLLIDVLATRRSHMEHTKILLPSISYTDLGAALMRMANFGIALDDLTVLVRMGVMPILGDYINPFELSIEKQSNQILIKTNYYYLRDCTLCLKGYYPKGAPYTPTAWKTTSAAILPPRPNAMGYFIKIMLCQSRLFEEHNGQLFLV